LKQPNSSNGFTLIELLTVIAIISIICSMLFPALAKSREKSRQTVCLSNARHIAFGLMEYVQDNDDYFMSQPDNAALPPDKLYAWYDVIQPYIGSYQILRCPSYSGELPITSLLGMAPTISTYAISAHVIWKANSAYANIDYPANTLLIAETPSGVTWFAEYGSTWTAPDLLMSNGEMHYVEEKNGFKNDFDKSAISAIVTGIAVDGHVKGMHMNDINGGGVTQDSNGIVHDPLGGWNGLYVTGPDGSLSF